MQVRDEYQVANEVFTPQQTTQQGGAPPAAAGASLGMGRSGAADPGPVPGPAGVLAAPGMAVPGAHQSTTAKLIDSMPEPADKCGPACVPAQSAAMTGAQRAADRHQHALLLSQGRRCVV